jgi:hypothetical protein
MEARNRKIEDWYSKIKYGEIKLPRFQRFEAWDRNRICSLMETVIRDLPLGITLVLETGEKEQFISRYLKTAPETQGKVNELLLDGQQRLTACEVCFSTTTSKKQLPLPAGVRQLRVRRGTRGHDRLLQEQALQEKRRNATRSGATILAECSNGDS